MLEMKCIATKAHALNMKAKRVDATKEENLPVQFRNV